MKSKKQKQLEANLRQAKHEFGVATHYLREFERQHGASENCPHYMLHDLRALEEKHHTCEQNLQRAEEQLQKYGFV